MSKSIVQIIFENKDFVVCDKLSMTLSVPDRFNSGRPCLGLELQKQLKTQIFPVHRLDYEVSGLIMYAKNHSAHKQSQQWFYEKKIQKQYRAYTLAQDFLHWPTDNKTSVKDVIESKPTDEMLWKCHIVRGKKRSFVAPHGDAAETKARIVEFKDPYLQWDLFPVTGRSHQLRLELSRHGFPIIGDQLYGSRRPISEIQTFWPWGGVALRAIGLKVSDQNINLDMKL